MLKSIDYKRFFISLLLISTFVGITLVNLDTASNIFNSTQSFIANNFGWLSVAMEKLDWVEMKQGQNLGSSIGSPCYSVQDWA